MPQSLSLLRGLVLALWACAGTGVGRCCLVRAGRYSRHFGLCSGAVVLSSPLNCLEMCFLRGWWRSPSLFPLWLCRLGLDLDLAFAHDPDDGSSLVIPLPGHERRKLGGTMRALTRDFTPQMTLSQEQWSVLPEPGGHRRSRLAHRTPPSSWRSTAMSCS